MKHNGIEYTETMYGDVTHYDGGAIGGVFFRMPGNFYRFLSNTTESWEIAAKWAQEHQRKQYERYREFVTQYEKETLK